MLLIGVSETIKIKAKEQNGGFLGMLLRSLGAILLRNLLTGKGVAKDGKGVIRVVEEVIRAGEGTIGTCPNFYCSLIL